MPYIVTTTTPWAIEPEPARGGMDEPDLPGVPMVDSVAVATRFEAAEEAAHRIEVITGGDPDYEEIYTDAQSCSELGEKFGPLQDGSVVEVELTSWPELAEKAYVNGGWSMKPAEIINRYNSQQEGS